ncbi:MAG: nuclear transport factor 2 family protein [Gemmatimonadales bacterium]
MKQLLTSSILLVLVVSPLRAQDSEDDVMRPVRVLFDAMRRGDSAAVRAVFHEEGRLTRAPGHDEELIVNEAALERFIAAIGTPHDSIWDERIWDWQVEIDGNMAQVWIKYAFYLGGRFSHCGVDALQLVKSGGRWVILNLMDTMRRGDACSAAPRPRDGSLNSAGLPDNLVLDS